MEKRNLHAHIFDAIRDPLVVVDAAGDIQAANASALRLFDLDGGVDAHLRTSGARLSIDARPLVALVKSGQRARGVPVVDRVGRDTGIVVDVEPLAVAGRHRLLHFRARTEVLQRELWTDEAVASVAHEFRNPLASMKYALDVIASGAAGDISDVQRRFIDTFRRGTARLARMVDGYLDLARVRAGVLMVARTEDDVRVLVAEVVSDLTTLHPGLAGRLACDIHDDIARAYLDRDRMEQVLLNLVANALRFTPEDRGVTVRVSRAGREALDDDLRLLPWEQMGDPRWVRFDVEDQGIGMSPETLAHAFDRYHGAENEAHAAGSGAHLGLHIARAMVEAHDGWMLVESRLGVGTVVSVFVPEDEETAVRFARIRLACAAVGRLRAARRAAALVAIGGEDGCPLRALEGAWAEVAVVNPTRPDAAPGDALVWVLSDLFALGIVPGGAEDAAVELRAAAGRDGSRLAVGACAVADGATFAQVAGRATARMWRPAGGPGAGETVAGEAALVRAGGPAIDCQEE